MHLFIAVPMTPPAETISYGGGPIGLHMKL
jgi:hypothetical protein